MCMCTCVCMYITYTYLRAPEQVRSRAVSNYRRTARRPARPPGAGKAAKPRRGLRRRRPEGRSGKSHGEPPV